jgi:site-specific DNA-methyltransferase (adenine-specific)
MICTESYLLVGPYADEIQAENVAAFLTTRTVRYLVAATLYTQNITRERFDFVPMLPMTRAWTDAELYDLLNLTQDEISHIESIIRPWGQD